MEENIHYEKVYDFLAKAVTNRIECYKVSDGTCERYFYSIDKAIEFFDLLVDVHKNAGSSEDIPREVVGIEFKDGTRDVYITPKESSKALAHVVLCPEIIEITY